MKYRISLFAPLLILAACGRPDSDAVEQPDPGTMAQPESDSAQQAETGTAEQPAESAAAAEPPEASEAAVDTSTIQITDGLSAQILQEGDGDPAEVGQIAVVHYTGWLYDESAENHRGNKFDSSLDRDKPFSFMLDEGRVIKGWDQGVVGMKVGERRELTIAPEMGYRDRDDIRVIPPGSTLVFEIELLELTIIEAAAEE
jgi:FKBP-type peptidyl-prolyl cis-trans isomerase